MVFIALFESSFILLNSNFKNTTAKINPKVSAINALQSIVTRLPEIVVIIITIGIKKKTSRDNAIKVDLKLDHIDCKIMEIDFVMQVKTIQAKNILKQYFAYS